MKKKSPAKPKNGPALAAGEGNAGPLRPFLIALCLAVLIAAVYGQMIGHDFIHFDDDEYITANPMVRQGLTLEGLVWAFTGPHAHNWHPLTSLSHMVDIELFDLHAGGHHMMGMLFHMANSLLLFWLFRAMTGSFWPSAAVAALFALHPLHVESVAWASERKDLLSTFFTLLTLGSYVRYVRKPGFLSFIPVVLCYASGLLAKQMAVTLPFLLLLLDYWPLGRLRPASAAPTASPLPEGSATGIAGIGKGPVGTLPEGAGARKEETPFTPDWRRLPGLVLEKWPLFLLAVAASIMVFLVQSETGVVKSEIQYPLSVRLENAVFSYAAYLIKTFWPLHLAVFYPHPEGSLPLWKVAGAALLILAISVFLWRSRRPYLVTGWCWYLGTLVPVIGLVQVGVQGMADRYTYVPLIGLFLMVAWGLAEYGASHPSRRAPLIAVSVAVLLILTILTRFQVATWRNDLTIFSHAAAVTSGNYWAEYNLGLALVGAGRPTEALPHFQEAIRLRPGHANAHLNIGVIRAQQGDVAGASALFTRALEIDPQHGEARINLALTCLAQGDVDGAASHIETLRRLRPRDPKTWFLRGFVSAKQGDPRAAESAYEEALRLNPAYAEAQNNLGILLARQGRLEAAVGRFREALRIQPGYREAEANLRSALAGQSRAR